jgi:hypothetical protein
VLQVVFWGLLILLLLVEIMIVSEHGLQLLYVGIGVMVDTMLGLVVAVFVRRETIVAKGVPLFQIIDIFTIHGKSNLYKKGKKKE